MSNDFLRVDPNVLEHPKIVRLVARFKEAGFVALYRLWAHAAKFSTDGRLDDITAQELGAITKVSRQPEAFIQALVDLKLLDKDGDTFVIHNWEKRQPFLATAKARSERNRENAISSWEKRPHAQSKEARDKPLPPVKKPDQYQTWLTTILLPAFPAKGRCQQVKALRFLRAEKPNPSQLDAFMEQVKQWAPVWTEGGWCPGLHSFLIDGKYREAPEHPKSGRNDKAPAPVPPTADEFYRGRA